MVSRTTLARIKSGGVTYCTDCGLKLAQALQAEDKIAGVEFGLGFLEQLKALHLRERGRN